MNSNDSSFNGETTSSGILWAEVLCRIPFVKNPSVKSENIVRINSKNEVEEEDALQIEQYIQKQEVILSHSQSLHSQEHCRGIVEDVEYQEKNIKVTVSSDSAFPIWEDTDIWMYSLSTPANSLYTTEPNTSADSEPTLEELKNETTDDMDQAGLLQSINGWKLINMDRSRTRRKEGGKWRNVYKTELVMTCVDPSKQELLEHIKERTSLRLSDDIDTMGDVLVDVLSKSVDEKNLRTVTLGVTGFVRDDVNISLTKDTTFYLNIYDLDDDDLASLASENYVLPGYPLEQNLDELCEKVGDLTILDVCVKTWNSEEQNYCYIRLEVTSAKKLTHFKLLLGHHVTIQSTHNERSSVLAVVSRVMTKGMILTLKGIPKHNPEFYFSKTDCLRIQIADDYEERLRNLTGSKALSEKFRVELANAKSDIRFRRFWNDPKGKFAEFSIKSEVFQNIPYDTKVILGKCWELEGQLEQKANFVFATRVMPSSSSDCSSSTVNINFQIKNFDALVTGAGAFQVSKAFYYVELDSIEEVSDDPDYRLLNARSVNLPRGETVAKGCPIGEDLKFLVFPNTFLARNEKKRQQLGKNQPRNPGFVKKWGYQKQGEQHELTNDLIRKKTLVAPEHKTVEKEEKALEMLSPVVTQAPEVFQHPTVNSFTPRFQDMSASWKNLQEISKKHKQMCFAYVSNERGYDNREAFVKLEPGFDEQGNKVKINALDFDLGKPIYLTNGVNEKEIKIQGEVVDSKKTVGFL
ncbi:hypothetical protein CRE_02972 [Caenorhabditis remanei]|uniref:Uncharacterized protein n=1 Tax=Caenorhabditis remanei TaxID=31234 RepID=E3LX00_CAERE|nr:hypothetical protein CRE_02972 [Caenorhabditis remanei]